MQLMPATARYIARKSGGTQFERDDLATPQINIAYGAWYLRYLLRRYGGNETSRSPPTTPARATSTAGSPRRQARDRALTITAIPFAETRAYVSRVLTVRGQYRRSYASSSARRP